MTITLDDLIEDVLTVICLHLDMKDAISLYMTGNKNMRSAIEKTKFDFFESKQITCTVQKFRNIFKNAIGLNIFNGISTNNNVFFVRINLTEDDLKCIVPKNSMNEPMKGVRIRLDRNDSISDSNMHYFRGVHTLRISYSNITDASLQYLTGIHTLHLVQCDNITSEGLKYLTGIHTLNIINCKNITDTGLQYLTGIKNLDICGCTMITDTGLQYLTGIHALNISHCNNITDIGLQYLTGIHTLDMSI